MPKPFVKGEDKRRGHGGARKNAGRDSDWLKAKCQEQIDRYDLMGFLGKVAGGEDVEQVVTSEGTTLYVPAPVKDRLRATEMLLDRKFGKVPQPLEHSGELANHIIVEFKS
jgi:hypothetical protein